MRPRLLIFDVDGTLIDSQAHIVAAMDHAFSGEGLLPPPRAEVLSIVGLSLPQAMARLVPDATTELRDRLVDGYKQGFVRLRSSGDGAALSPLFDGAADALEALADRDDLILGIATGKSRRGMAHVFDMHGIRSKFLTVQTADDHPSKPHPAMIEACLAETGIAAADAAILGDTTYDIEMGRNAGITALGVSWGYHSTEALKRAGARSILGHFRDLPQALTEIWEPA